MFRNGLRESSGPTDMRVGSVPTLNYLRRVGNTLIGVATTIASVLRFGSSDYTLTGPLVDGNVLTVSGATIIGAPGGGLTQAQALVLVSYRG